MKGQIALEEVDRYRDDTREALAEWEAIFTALCPPGLSTRGREVLSRRLLHAALAIECDIKNIGAWMREEIPRAMERVE